MLDKLTPSAKIVDGILVITLPDALSPVVWQLELGLSKSSAMEVRQKEDGTFLLVLKTPRQDVQDIAPYATREQAVRALLTISRALEAGQGRLRNANSNNPYHLPAVIPGLAATASGFTNQTTRTPKTLRIIAGVLIAIALVYLFTRSSAPTLPAADMTSSSPAAAGSAPVGVPLSAEDYLNAP